jgi:hypothetical protein
VHLYLARGVWDCFLFSHPEADIVDQVEKAKGLWYSTEELEFLDSVNLFHVLRCNSKNRIHFSGFIADLLLKLEKKIFPGGFGDNTFGMEKKMESSIKRNVFCETISSTLGWNSTSVQFSCNLRD